MKTENTYYYVPAWMSSIIYIFMRAGLVQKLKNRERTSDGMYLFADSEEKSREETLIVWDRTTSAKITLACLIPLLSMERAILVNMIQEYSRERGDREETIVCSCIIQLLIARATELYCQDNPGKTLVIEGNFRLIGQLPPHGQLRINGKVERVEGSTGTSLEIKCQDCPQLHLHGIAYQEEGVWKITRTRPTCVFPPG